MEDFGFTFENDGHQIAAQANEENVHQQITIADLQKQIKAHGIFKIKIMTFLNNLKRDPDKPTIRWPNRVEAIDNFIKELESIEKG